jgi:SAM-dependent methyltransferase
MVKILLSNIEYILLRLFRRFVFTGSFLIKYGAYIPYYRVNLNQFNPRSIVGDYKKYLEVANIDPMKLYSVLEIGSGVTNSSGYEMAFQGFAQLGRITIFEPHVDYDQELDNKIFSDCGYVSEIRDTVYRIRNLSDIEPNTVDLVLSNSVLEHVDDFSGLMTQLKRVLKPGAFMLHIVDYRDHFLQFSKRIWDNYLNPGDLPRWRLGEHIEILSKENLLVEILSSEIDESALAKIKLYIHPMFDANNRYISITRAVLLIKPM